MKVGDKVKMVGSGADFTAVVVNVSGRDVTFRWSDGGLGRRTEDMLELVPESGDYSGGEV